MARKICAESASTRCWCLLLIACLALPLLTAKAVSAESKEVFYGDEQIVIKYSFPPPSITKVGEYDSVAMDGLGKIQKSGHPRLPFKSVTVLVPFEAKINKIEVIPGAKHELPGFHMIEPCQRPVPLSHRGPVDPTPPAVHIYTSNGPYPGILNSKPVEGIKGAFRLISFNLYPLEYFPRAGRLLYCEEVTVKFHTEQLPVKALGKKRAPKSHESLHTRKLIENPQTMESYPVDRRDEGRPEFQSLYLEPSRNCPYVIITAEALAHSAFEDLVASKEARGIRATIVTTEWIYANYDGTRPDGKSDNQTKIRNFIVDANETWGTEYVLLGGNSHIVPPRLLWVQSWEAGFEVEMPADLYYGCLDGTFDEDRDGVYGEPNDGPDGTDVDLYYEVYIGRALIENESDVDNFVAKTLAYENSADPYLHIASMAGERLSSEGAGLFAKDYLEEIRVGSDAHGYSTSGFENSPFSSFFVTDSHEIAGCAGPPPPLYDRDWENNDWPFPVLVDFVNEIKCGYPGVHIINHLGHADYWYCLKLRNSDLALMTNNRFFFLYSQGCNAGGFDREDCFAEAITSMAYGAFSAIMNARFGWGSSFHTDGPSQRYNRVFWHAVLEERIVELGRANAFSKEYFGYEHIGDDCMRWCYYQTNLFGDPEASLKIGNERVWVKETTIDDDGDNSSVGDGDGIAEPGETIELSVVLHNPLANSALAVTATLSTDDNMIGVLNSTQFFGEIPPGQSAASQKKFRFYVDESCPDDHFALFTLQIFHEGGSWTDSFLIEVHKEPEIRLSSQQVSMTVGLGEKATEVLGIENRGMGVLEFRLAAGAISEMNEGMPLSLGGPDKYGYLWTDSNEVNGPKYEWVEISQVGVALPLFGVSFREIALPFDFPFYGENKSRVTVSSQGYLIFGRDGYTSLNGMIPSQKAPNGMIAPFWDNLYPYPGGAARIMYYHDQPNSRFIVEYQEVGHAGSGGFETFEVILYADGRIVYQYKKVSNARSCTVGIENMDGTDGLQVVYNGSYLRDGLAVVIYPSGNWLSLEPESGKVEPGEAVDIEAIFNSAGLAPGTYETNIIVSSNDPDQPQLVIPAVLRVIQ